MSTKLLSFNCSRLLLAVTFVVCGFFIANNILAAATVSTLANKSMSADAYTSYVSLAGPVISEAVTGDIGVGTIILNAPSGFQFNSGASVNVLVSLLSGTGTNINGVASGSTISATVADSQISLTITSVSTGTVKDKLTWQGIQVRPVSGTIPTGTQNITKAGTAIISGITGTTNFGTLTETAGVPTNVVISSTDTSLIPRTSFKVIDTARINMVAKDAYGNTVGSGKSVDLQSSLGTLSNCTGITDGLGSAFCNLISHTTGTANFTITGFTTSGDVSTNFVHGFFNKIVASASPESAPIGQNVSVTVSGADFYGNVITEDNSTIVLLSANNGGNLTSTSLTLTSGTATTTLTKSLPGTVNVTASSGSYTAGSVQVVFSDNASPIISTHENITTEATSSSGAVVSYTLPTATDNVDSSVVVACLPVSGATFTLGTSIITCTASDIAGNTATSNFNIIVRDTTLPVVTAPANINTIATALGKAVISNLGTPTISDAVDSNPKVTNNAPLSGFPLGATEVTWTVVDSSGNTATAIQTITISPAPTDHLDLVVPSSLAFNQSGEIKVYAKDQYGNKNTNDNSTTTILYVDDLSDVNLTMMGGEATSTISKTDAFRDNKDHFVHVSISSQPGVIKTIKFTPIDIDGPYVESMIPANTSSNVNPSAVISLTFSEALDTTTVNSANIQLKKYSDDSSIEATISPAEGNKKVIITPKSLLDFSTQYYFAVSSDVKDLAGNSAVALDNKTKADNAFTTIADNTTYGVTNVTMTKQFATADNTFENGWKWVFDVTVPETETQLKMKFNDWTGVGGTISASTNIKYYSDQADTAKSTATAIAVEEAGAYSAKSANVINLADDSDSSKPGRQIKITVEARVPASAGGGSYSTSYGIQTLSAPK